MRVGNKSSNKRCQNAPKKATVLKIVLTALFGFTPLWSNAQITMEAYNPTSTLVVPEHIVSAAKYPFIDAHSHQYLGPRKIPKIEDGHGFLP